MSLSKLTLSNTDMLILTMQTAQLFTLLSPARAALIDCMHIHAVHLPVGCEVCCPEKKKLCYKWDFMVVTL